MSIPAHEVINAARELAYSAHAGQTRRDGFTPYILHPFEVTERLVGEPPEVLAAAWLHDTLEDTHLTREDLRTAGFPEPVIDAVVALTKVGEMRYEDYVERVKANPIARKVKIADMLANLADAPTDAQILRYAKGLTALMQRPGTGTFDYL